MFISEKTTIPPDTKNSSKLLKHPSFFLFLNDITADVWGAMWDASWAFRCASLASMSLGPPVGNQRLVQVSWAHRKTRYRYKMHKNIFFLKKNEQMLWHGVGVEVESCEMKNHTYLDLRPTKGPGKHLLADVGLSGLQHVTADMWCVQHHFFLAGQGPEGLSDPGDFWSAVGVLQHGNGTWEMDEKWMMFFLTLARCQLLLAESCHATPWPPSCLDEPANWLIVPCRATMGNL